jgi:hypothetical protein
MSEPYAIRKCRGHFHVTVEGTDIHTDVGDALDEEKATQEAARLNAEWRESHERKDAEIARLTAELARLKAIPLAFAEEISDPRMKRENARLRTALAAAADALDIASQHMLVRAEIPEEDWAAAETLSARDAARATANDGREG